MTRGFTIIETLVAIAIILIAIVGPFDAVEHALTASYVARDQLIANSLAQEGVEFVESVRDDNYLYNSINHTTINFLGGLDGTPNGLNTMNADCFNNLCIVDALENQITSNPPAPGPASVCTGSVCPPLNAFPDGIYTQRTNIGGTVPTRFTRSIQLCYMEYSGGVYTGCKPTGPSNEVQLTVTVTWNTEGQSYHTTVTDYLQNWL